MKKPLSTDRLRINHKIRVPEVRVISETGEQLGVLNTSEAMARAQERGLDLVEVAPQAKPPVCKILDYGKFKYDKSKKDKHLKSKNKQTIIKMVKLTPNIGESDLLRKIEDVKKFLEKGCRVQVEVRMKGRQNMHADLAVNQIQRINDELNIAPEGKIERQGGKISVTYQGKVAET